LLLAEPFVGLGGCHALLTAAGVDFESLNVYDTEPRLREFYDKLQAEPGATYCGYRLGPALGDVSLVPLSTLDDVDALVAGPSCKDFSISGKRKGLEGETSSCYLITLDWAVVLGQRGTLSLLLIENSTGVTALCERYNTSMLSYAMSMLRDELPHFVFDYVTLNAANYIPVNRERLFLRGMRADALDRVQMRIPRPLQSFPSGVVRLEDVLDFSVPNISRASLTPKQLSNLQV
jgi:site-specific DNA-cytosine methylase